MEILFFFFPTFTCRLDAIFFFFATASHLPAWFVGHTQGFLQVFQFFCALLVRGIEEEREDLRLSFSAQANGRHTMSLGYLKIQGGTITGTKCFPNACRDGVSSACAWRLLNNVCSQISILNKCFLE